MYPEKPGLIPTFCKRINRTQPAVEIWVRAFEERDERVQQNLYTTTINRVLHQMEYTTNWKNSQKRVQVRVQGVI